MKIFVPFKSSSIIYFLSLLTIALVVMPGCGKLESAKKGIVAYVNKEPIFASDLKREIALRMARDPTFRLSPESESDEMDIIINKKIIIQKAMEAGLSREDRFVNTIKNFWEQTLIRDFLDYIRREFKKEISLSEDDIKRYYINLSETVTFKVVKARNAKYLAELYSELKKNRDSENIPWQLIGPVGYEDITSGVLLDAYEMPVGEVKKVEEEPDYYLIQVVARDKKAVDPLEKIKPEIKKRIVEMKERRLFEKWLKNERKKAKIKIITQ